jgi:hypothetical protein
MSLDDCDSVLKFKSTPESNREVSERYVNANVYQRVAVSYFTPQFWVSCDDVATGTLEMSDPRIEKRQKIINIERCVRTISCNKEL